MHKTLKSISLALAVLVMMATTAYAANVEITIRNNTNGDLKNRNSSCAADRNNFPPTVEARSSERVDTRGLSVVYSCRVHYRPADSYRGCEFVISRFKSNPSFFSFRTYWLPPRVVTYAGRGVTCSHAFENIRSNGDFGVRLMIND